ncbi:hypothetical protein ABIA32_005554 [Streptacidiphilus sp. MAP12-20]|uniref:hypothetical protein n=1 Tax=Streptacidiphilus sp. MAP12-20 TaxID=3156299 RepID=UPI0035125A87
MRRQRRGVVWLVGAVALAGAIGGCGHGGAQPPIGTSAGPSGSPQSSAGTPGPRQTQPPARSSTSTPTSLPTLIPTPPGASTHCLTGGARLVVPTGDNPLRTTCVRVGATVRVSLTARTGSAWGQVASSAPGVVQIEGVHPLPPGSELLVARAVAPGTAVLRAVETAADGTQSPWELTVTVVP